MINSKKSLMAWVIFSAFAFLNICSIISHSYSITSELVSKTTSDIVYSAKNDDYEQVQFSKLYLYQRALEKKPHQVKYTVKQGDTLWDISCAYNINIASIINANNLDSPDKLKVGQEITIPGATELKEVNSKAAMSVNSPKLASRSNSSFAKSLSVSGIWPVNGILSSGYGIRDGSFHKGIDIAVPYGTGIHAFAEGIVLFSGWDKGGYGNLIIISHGNGIETYYAHNSKLLVSTGQPVSKGQLIANAGSTGDATGSHCHFEIRKDGAPVNPLNILK